VALAVAGLGYAPAARAQSGYFYLDRVQFAGAPDDGLTVFRPYAGKSNRLFASAGLGYAHNPLRKDIVTDDAGVANAIQNPVKGQLVLYNSFGAQLGGLLTATVSLPVSLWRIAGDDPQARGVGTGGLTDSRIAAHDLRLDARLRTFETDDGGARFGLGAAVWTETGNSNALAGDGQMTGWLYGAAEFDFDDFFVSGHVGPHFRPENSIGGPNGDLYVGSELRWAFGIYLPMREGRVRVGGELFGTTGLLDSVGPNDRNTIFSGNNTALEWLGQVRLNLIEGDGLYLNAGGGTRLSTGYGAPDFRVLVALGTSLVLDAQGPERRHVQIVSDARDYDADSDKDGYPDDVDQCATLPEDRKGAKPTDGCPENVDRDNDGIPDKDDQCPNRAEDKDGIQDEDGCPEDDSDADGIPDASDKCPTEAGERSADPTLHGCPLPDQDNDGILNKEDRCPTDPGPRSQDPERNGCPSLTRVVEGRVELLQAIEFQTGRAVVLKSSYPILDEVVTLLIARPTLRLALHGHTDDRGQPARNLELSKQRAQACVQYLIDRGVDPSRLESHGFGQKEPIADNTTAEGRAKNRRVEFKILGD
jgi:outer membrane protein OmpA-like peptidoglycan-associated protein